MNMFRFSNLTKCLAVGVCVGGLQLNAANVLTSGNSKVDLDLVSQMGMNSWVVDGVNQLYQQWFWYRAGTSPEASIDTLGAPVVVQNTANQLTSTYSGSGFQISVVYTLLGGAAGSGDSTVNEAIVINNLGSSTLDFHFFQYSDYALGGVDKDIVQMAGTFDNVLVTSSASGAFMGETSVSPIGSRGEVKPYDVTLLKLNDGVATDLDGTLGPDGPGDITFAFQWDLSIGPGLSRQISKIKSLHVPVIPEPTTGMLALVGLALLAARNRRN